VIAYWGWLQKKQMRACGLHFFVSLLPLFQTSFDSRLFQNKNAPFGALFFLAESEDCEPNSPTSFISII
jgi:hypothetical protein